MAIKRIIGRYGKKYRSCLRCSKATEQTLRDDTIFICDNCGQQHFVDVYPNCIALTVIERPEVRKRHIDHITPQQQRARERLIDRVEARRRGLDAWEEKYRDWLEELAELPEREREVEFSLMDEEMLRRVKKYLDKRITA